MSWRVVGTIPAVALTTTLLHSIAPLPIINVTIWPRECSCIDKSAKAEHLISS